MSLRSAVLCSLSAPLVASSSAMPSTSSSRSVGRCCRGMTQCPVFATADAVVDGCSPLESPCSSSAWLCASPGCSSRHLRQKAIYCPAVPPSSCALGDNVRVVTDMGWDDFGAFAVLNAAGCTPQKAMGVQGMMHSNFTGNLSKLLQSWYGNATTVYQGPPDGSCFDSSDPCDFDPKWLEDYRTNMLEKLPTITKLPWDKIVSDGVVSTDVEEFWSCKDEQYVLLVISPQSAVASRLLDRVKGNSTRACIKEIVFMGGMFDNVQLSQTDRATADSFNGPRSGKESGPAFFTETNIIADVPAAHALWQANSLKVPMRIFSLETASSARAGLQRLYARGQVAGYDDKMQNEEDKKAHDEVRKTLDCAAPANMLTKMLCIHDSPGDVYTADFDAIAATYVWMGNRTQDLMSFEGSRVMVNMTTGVTTRSVDRNSSISVATAFNAIKWLDALAHAARGEK